MKVLHFCLILDNEKITLDLVNQINTIFNCELKQYDSDRRHKEEVWEAELFGIEIDLSCYYDGDEIVFQGLTEKITHYMPADEKRECTDISEEVLNIFKVFMPNKKWRKGIKAHNNLI